MLDRVNSKPLSDLIQDERAVHHGNDHRQDEYSDDK